MGTFLQIDLDTFAFIICGGMLVVSLRLPGKSILQNRLFRLLIAATMVMLLTEALGWTVDGHPGILPRSVNVLANMLGFVVAPVPATVWALYASYQLFHDINRFKKEAWLLSIPVVVNASLTITSPATSLFFTVDNGNLYQRGPLFLLLAVFSLMPVIYTTIIYIGCRKRMPRSLFYPIMMFSVPVLLGALIQFLFYGLSVTWSAMTVSIFIVHTGLHNRQFHMDHLTGVYNRRQLDNRLNDLLQAGPRQMDFTCIMLDINNFKSINDRYGHVAGDEALRQAASLLKSCIRSSDFIARYAGDEFVILLGVSDEGVVCDTISRIHDRAARFNSEGIRPYKLEFSVGYEICRHGSGLTKEMLITRVDKLMYQDKNDKRMSYAHTVSQEAGMP
jgi:diguanylate cyclase (GGDEF)-like protein